MSSSTPPRRIVVDDTDPGITYSFGQWTQSDVTKLDNGLGNLGPTYNGSSHQTSSDGAVFGYSFKGTDVSVFGTLQVTTVNVTTGAVDPTWECQVDDKTIDNPSPNFKFPENNWLLCNTSSLAPGPHVLTVRVHSKGTPFFFDSLIYTPTQDVNIEGAVLEYKNTDPAVSYSSGWIPYESQGNFQNITQTSGSQATLKFIGTSVRLLSLTPFELPHAAAFATYSIDGNTPTQFQLAGLAPDSVTTLYNTLELTTVTLPPGPHTLVVTYNGDSSHTPLGVSRFYVTNSSHFPASTTFGSSSVSGSLGPSGTAGSSTEPPASSASSSKSTPVGAIAGGVVGGLVLVAVIAFLFFFWRRRQRRKYDTPEQTLADPFMGGGGGPVSMSSANATNASQYPYTAVPGAASNTWTPYGGGAPSETASYPGQQHSDISHGAAAYPYVAPGAGMAMSSHTVHNSVPGTAPTHMPQASMSSAPPADGMSSGSASSYSGVAQNRPSMRVANVPITSDQSVSSVGSGSRSKHEEALSPNRRPVVMRQHADSGVRLNRTPSTMTAQVVDVPPGYTPD